MAYYRRLGINDIAQNRYLRRRRCNTKNNDGDAVQCINTILLLLLL